MEQISEAVNKCFVADFIFSVSRTIEDKQKNLGKIFIAKNRNGPDGMIYPILMDTSNVKIRILPKNNPHLQNGKVPLNPVTLDSSMQRDLLQRKYTKLKKKGIKL